MPSLPNSVYLRSEIEIQLVSGLATPPSDPIYCVVVRIYCSTESGGVTHTIQQENQDPAGLTDTAYLVVNDGAGSFSLCQDNSGLEVVVYDAEQNNGYDVNSCTGILVHVHYVA